MNVSSTRDAAAVSSPRVVVTTSWDDDAASGMRVGQILGERGIQGTFYVPTGQLNGGSRFTGGNLQTLSGDGFEIGAHTISHRMLTGLSPAEQAEEVGGCKSILEQMLGREVAMFCYPRGRFDAHVLREVEKAGYRGARTTRMLCWHATFPRFKMPTTVQAYPHRRSNYWRNLARLGGVSALVQSVPDMIRYENWIQLAKRVFDRVLRDGGVWHLYGHAWELEKLDLWDGLNEVLDYVGGRDGVAYLTNAQVLLSTSSPYGMGHTDMTESREHSLIH